MNYKLLEGTDIKIKLKEHSSGWPYGYCKDDIIKVKYIGYAGCHHKFCIYSKINIINMTWYATDNEFEIIEDNHYDVWVRGDLIRKVKDQDLVIKKLETDNAEYLKTIKTMAEILNKYTK